jgi:hypothetical protein
MHPYLASSPLLAQWLAQHHHALDAWQTTFAPLAPPPAVTKLSDEGRLRQHLLTTLQAEFGARVGQNLWRESPQFRHTLKANTCQAVALSCQPTSPN